MTSMEQNQNHLLSSPLTVSSRRPIQHSMSGSMSGSTQGSRSNMRPLVMRGGNTAGTTSSSSLGMHGGVSEGHHDMRKLEQRPTRQQRMTSGQSHATTQDPEGWGRGDTRIAEYQATGGMHSLPPDPRSVPGGDMHMEHGSAEIWNPETEYYRAGPTTPQVALSPRPLSETPLPPSPWEGDQGTPNDGGYLRVPSGMSPMTPNGDGNQGYLSIPSAMSPRPRRHSPQQTARHSISDVTGTGWSEVSSGDQQEYQEVTQNYMDQMMDNLQGGSADGGGGGSADGGGERRQTPMSPQQQWTAKAQAKARATAARLTPRRTTRPMETATSERSRSSSDQQEQYEMTQNYMDQMMENLQDGGGGGQRSKSQMTWHNTSHTHDSA